MTTSPLKIILLAAALYFPLPAFAVKNILVFGDSLSAGYGIATEKSWVSLLQRELQLRHPQYRIINASISGETTQGGRRRIAQALQQHRPAVVIVELGANDGLRGSANANTEANLTEIIKQAKRSGARVLLIGMRLPPNYGTAYTAKFHQIFPRLAKKYQLGLLPFLLEGVPSEQFQSDNLHPTSAAQPHIMRSVLKELKLLLR